VVSTGNVAQLAIDLFIATFGMKRIAILDSQHLVPTVGAREDGEEGITTPLELYGKEGLNIVAIQQRSPVIKAQKENFVTSILAFIEQSRFSAVLLLTGVDLSDRPEHHMEATTYHLTPTTPKVSLHPQWMQQLDRHIPPFLTTTHHTSLSELPIIPGSGLTRRIISSLPESFPPTAVVLEYVLEGDNRDDAKLLASAVAKALQQELGVTGSEPWKEPTSWRFGLFGSEHDQTLFG